MNIRVRHYLVSLPDGFTLDVESGGTARDVKTEVAAWYGLTSLRRITVKEIK